MEFDDQSILAKPGMVPCNEIELGEDLEMSPQATSTAVTKKTRQDLIDDIVKNTNEREVNALADQEEIRKEEDNGIKSKKLHKSYQDLSSVPVLNIDGMKGLSSSFILVDSNGKIPSIKISSQSSESESGCEADIESETPAMLLTRQDLATPDECTHYEYSGDNRGEGKAVTSEDNQGGLPSCLLEPKGTNELAGCSSTQELVWSSFMSTMENSCEPRAEPQDDKKVNFQPEISAQSTVSQEDYPVVGLPNNCHNSLGSHGKSAGNCDKFSIGSQYLDSTYFSSEDQFKANSMFEEESFRAITSGFLEKEQKEWEKKDNDFTSVNDNTWNIASCSGVMEKSNITVRPSWIQSPEKGLIKPGAKIPFEEFIKLRSEALGCLGDNECVERPHFGVPADSPPSIQAPKALIDLSDTTSTTFPQAHMDVSNSKQNPSDKSPLSSDSTSTTESSRHNSDQSTFKNKKLNNPKSSYANGTLTSTFMVPLKSDAKFSHALNERQKDQDVMKSTEDVLQPPDAETVKMLKTKELEKILEETKGPITAERLFSLLQMAFLCDDPKLMVEKITRFSKEPSAQECSFDITDMDVSREVKELRSQRLALVSDLQAKVDEPESCVNGVVKSHKMEGARPKNLSGGTSQSMENLRSHDSKTRMEENYIKRLYLYKTESLPVVKTNNDEKEGSSRTLCPPGAIEKEETIILPPQVTAILEDSQGSHITSFKNSSSSGFHASAPFLSRQQGVCCLEQEPKQIMEESMKNVYISHSVPEMYNKLTAVKSRPQSRMGFSPYVNKTSSDTADLTCYSSTSDIGRGLRVANGINLNHCSGLGRTPEKELVCLECSNRTISVPSGLHRVGKEDQLHPTGYLQSHNQQHSQEDVAGDNPAQKALFIPSEIQFPSSCLLNIASSTDFIFCNQMCHWLKLSLAVTRETINGQPCNLISFKPFHCIEPQQTCAVKFTVCSHQTGNYVAHIEVAIFDMWKLSKDCKGEPLLRKMIKVSAAVEIPKVEVLSEFGEIVDFGVLAEGCSISREVTLINKSDLSIPVILKTHEEATQEPVFCWEKEANARLNILTPIIASCELQPSNHGTGPFSLTTKVTLKAPSLAEDKVNEQGTMNLKSVLQVCVDSPNGIPVTIASVPMQAEVAVVRLRSLKINEPHEVRANIGESSVAEIPLFNASSIPLIVSLKIRQPKKGLSIAPNILKIKAHTQVMPRLTFKPQTQGRSESDLIVCVEPKGREYEIKVVGVCTKENHSEVVQQRSIHNASVKHKTVSRCISSPTPHQDKEDAEPALLSKTCIVWGTVNLNDSSGQGLPLKNVKTTLCLTLHIKIKGENCFKIFNDKGNSVRGLEVVLKPCEEISLMVTYTPSSVGPHEGIIICKPQGTSKPVRFQIPLQGYGGCSSLAFPDVKEEGYLIVRDLSATEPAMLQTFIFNRGDRAAFVRAQLFKDEQCTQPLSHEQATFHPMEMVICAGDMRAVVVAITTHSSNLRAAPGIVGYLQITHGDEILRKRFRRHSPKGVAPKGVSDPSLLAIDWNSYYSGEESVEEEDIFSPQSEDRKIFYKGITKKKIGIHVTEKSGGDNSSMIFAQLIAEDTVMSVIDDSVNDRGAADHSPVERQQISAGKVDIKDGSWDVYPSSLIIDSNDSNIHAVLVINYTTQPRMLEIVSKTSWLSVMPRELMLPSKGSASLKVTLNQMESIIPSQTTASVQICSENGDRFFQVNLRLVPGSCKMSDPVKPIAPKTTLSRHDSKKNETKTENLRQDNSKTKFLRQNNEKAEKSTRGLSSSKQRSSKVEVASTSLTFPATRVMKDNHIKITLYNSDSTVHQVTAWVSSPPFLIRHHQFQIKAGYFISVPVYFKPQKKGKYTAKLHFIVLADHKQLSVDLSGEAI